MALTTRVLPLVTSTVVVAWAATGDLAAVAVAASASTSVTRVIASTAMAAASATTLPALAMPSTQFILRLCRLYSYTCCCFLHCRCFILLAQGIAVSKPRSSLFTLQLTLQPRRPQQVSRHLLQIP
jgi:hypothetical protein